MCASRSPLRNLDVCIMGLAWKPLLSNMFGCLPDGGDLLPLFNMPSDGSLHSNSLTIHVQSLRRLHLKVLAQQALSALLGNVPVARNAQMTRQHSTRYDRVIFLCISREKKKYTEISDGATNGFNGNYRRKWFQQALNAQYHTSNVILEVIIFTIIWNNMFSLMIEMLEMRILIVCLIIIM